MQYEFIANAAQSDPISPEYMNRIKNNNQKRSCRRQMVVKQI